MEARYMTDRAQSSIAACAAPETCVPPPPPSLPHDNGDALLFLSMLNFSYYQYYEYSCSTSCFFEKVSEVKLWKLHIRKNGEGECWWSRIASPYPDANNVAPPATNVLYHTLTAHVCVHARARGVPSRGAWPRRSLTERRTPEPSSAPSLRRPLRP
jgi:hypothetical protein